MTIGTDLDAALASTRTEIALLSADLRDRFEGIDARLDGTQTKVDLLASSILDLEIRLDRLENPDPPPPIITPASTPPPAVRPRSLLTPAGHLLPVRGPSGPSELGPPATPTSWTEEMHAYPQGEAAGIVADRPLYTAGRTDAIHTARLADLAMSGTADGLELSIARALDRVDRWHAIMDPVESWQTGFGGVISTGLATGTNVMSGLVLAAGDLGHRIPGLDRWIARCEFLLDHPDFRRHHNFRASILTYLAFGKAAAGESTGWDLLRDQLNRHYRETIVRTNVNLLESGRPRSIHYQLIEARSLCHVATIINNQNRGDALDDATRSELETYFGWLVPHALAAVDADPVPAGRPPYTYRNADSTLEEVGPISRDHFGNALEWLSALGLSPISWSELPAGLRGRPSPYKDFRIGPRPG